MHMVSDQDTSKPVVRVIRDAAEWDNLREQWAALFDASPTASAPLRFDWLREWWRVYGPIYEAPGGGLSVFMFWRGSRLVGALPLYSSVDGGRVFGRRWLRFISTGEAESEETLPCYLDLLHLPGEEDGCLAALLPLLTNRREIRWDVLALQDFDERSPLAGWGRQFTGNFRATPVKRDVCPVADLQGGFDGYLQRLSHKTRQHARQYLRAAERDGATFELAQSSADAEAYFSDLVRLHQGRWTGAGRHGCFASTRFTEFHRGLAVRGVPDGWAKLARLTLGGETAAVLYGFLAGNEFEFYQSGVILEDKKIAAKSPGTTIILMLMRHLAAEGVAAFDFLGGAAAYKQRLSTDQRIIERLQVIRPGIRVAAHAAGGLVRRASRKGLSYVFGNNGSRSLAATEGGVSA